MLNTITVTMNAAKNAGMHHAVVRLQHEAESANDRRSPCAASARSIARSGFIGPAGRPSPEDKPRIAAKTTLATTLTAPPSSADHAPLQPANDAGEHGNRPPSRCACHWRTTRKGGKGRERSRSRERRVRVRRPERAEANLAIITVRRVPRNELLRRNGRHCPQRRPRIARPSAARKRADDHELARGGACAFARSRASSPSTKILMCGRIAPLLVDDPEAETGKPGVELGERVGERRRVPRSRPRPISAPRVYERSSPGIRTCIGREPSLRPRSADLDRIDVRQVRCEASSTCGLRRGYPTPRRSSCRSKRPPSARRPPSSPDA